MFSGAESDDNYLNALSAERSCRAWNTLGMASKVVASPCTLMISHSPGLRGLFGQVMLRIFHCASPPEVNVTNSILGGGRLSANCNTAVVRPTCNDTLDVHLYNIVPVVGSNLDDAVDAQVTYVYLASILHSAQLAGRIGEAAASYTCEGYPFVGLSLDIFS